MPRYSGAWSGPQSFAGDAALSGVGTDQAENGHDDIQNSESGFVAHHTTPFLREWLMAHFGSKALKGFRCGPDHAPLYKSILSVQKGCDNMAKAKKDNTEKSRVENLARACELLPENKLEYLKGYADGVVAMADAKHAETAVQETEE